VASFDATGASKASNVDVFFEFCSIGKNRHVVWTHFNETTTRKGLDAQDIKFRIDRTGKVGSHLDDVCAQRFCEVTYRRFACEQQHLMPI
jgi:hypothetical protein